MGAKRGTISPVAATISPVGGDRFTLCGGTISPWKSVVFNSLVVENFGGGTISPAQRNLLSEGCGGGTNGSGSSGPFRDQGGPFHPSMEGWSGRGRGNG